MTHFLAAIKKCKFKLVDNLTPRQRERWESEVSMMQSLKCINIARHVPLPPDLSALVGRTNPTELPVLSMEYCPLGNLRTVLTRGENSCGLHERDVAYVLSDIANALSYLHGFNVTHRDVKPENIVMAKSDRRRDANLYKLIDLGYAKELDSECVSFVGTLQYLAPEIFETKVYDCTVDYWSLGVLGFEVVCGMRPFFHGFSVAEDVSPAVG